MKKTMKLIDLLNKRAEHEEIPEKIRFDGYTLILNDSGLYKDEDGDYITAHICNDLSNLNKEVEILDEEEFEDIEEIEFTNDEKIKGYYNGETHYMTTNVKDREVYIKLINQLIKNQKKIIEKLNKNNITQ